MKPVKYHALAESDLVGSAAFYESRRLFLGDNFLDLIEETYGKFQTRNLIIGCTEWFIFK